MHKVPILAFSFVAFGTLALSGTPATAKEVSISGTHSAGEIRDKCDAAGGVYSGPGSKGYGCANSDKGTQIRCDNKGHCVGFVPRTTSPGSGIVNIMRGGTHPVSATGGKTPTGKQPVGKGIKPIEYKQSSSHRKN
jgi:hypothetical protein